MAIYGEGGGGKSRPWLGTALLAGALVLGLGFLLALTFWRGRSSSYTSTSELAHLKLLDTALKFHAHEHGGKFPPSIADIDWQQDFPGMRWAGLPAAVSQFHDPATGSLMKWRYYPGHSETDPPQTILAASPVPVGGDKDQRLVARLNGTAEEIDDATFQFEIKEQAGAH